MTTQSVTDPAARAVKILQLALQTQAQRSFLHFWANAFAVDPKNVVEIYYNLGLFRDLVEDIERAIKQVPDSRHDQSLKVIAQLRSTISQPNLQASWHQHRQVFEIIITGLEFVSERLQAHSPEPDLPTSELEALKEQTTQLIKQLESS